MKASKASVKQAHSMAELAARMTILEGQISLILSLLQQPKAPAKADKKQAAHGGNDETTK